MMPKWQPVTWPQNSSIKKKHAMASQPYHKPNLSYSGHAAKEPSTYSATFLQFNIHLFFHKKWKTKEKTKQMQ